MFLAGILTSFFSPGDSIYNIFCNIHPLFQRIGLLVNHSTRVSVMLLMVVFMTEKKTFFYLILQSPWYIPYLYVNLVEIKYY